jgi:hypothetical protein
MKTFFLKLILLSIVLCIADWCWNFSVAGNPIPHPYLIIAFFTAVTLFFHSIMLKNAGARPQVIVRYYMTGTVLRLFLFLLILIGYRFIDKPTLIPFAVAFILHYFAFTIFEVSQLTKQFRNQD